MPNSVTAKEISRALEAQLKQKGLSVRALTAAMFGIRPETSRMRYARRQSGRTQWSLAELKWVADHLGCKVSDLVTVPARSAARAELADGTIAPTLDVPTLVWVLDALGRDLGPALDLLARKVSTEGLGEGAPPAA